MQHMQSDAYEAQQIARKAMNPTGVKIDRKPTRPKTPDDFLSYLNETEHERLFTNDYLDIVKAKVILSMMCSSC